MLRCCLHAIALFTLGVVSIPSVHARTYTFSGTGSGPIPDGSPIGRSMTFSVGGLDAPVYTVRIAIDINHTWAGDVSATLTGPGGSPRLVLFGRTGTNRGSSFGANANLGGTYTFSDLGFPDFWPYLVSLGNNDTLPSGFFRTVTPGVPLRTDWGGCPTSLLGVFGGLTPTEASGTWTLVVSDAIAGDTGTLNSAVLVIETISLFRNGFEPGTLAAPPSPAQVEPAVRDLSRGIAAPAHCANKPLMDFTGDGLTDYVYLRPSGTGMQWAIRENLGNGTASSSETTFLHGQDSDFFDGIDVDGDRIADASAWRSGAPGSARYIVRLSSRTGPAREIVFGQNADVPNQVGDYDGDLIDDVGVIRAPPLPNPAAAIQVIYRASGDGLVRSVFLGTGNSGDIFALSGYDYDGDGRADVLSQQVEGTTARYRVFNAYTGAQVQTFTFGTINDFMIPGDFVGSSRTDLTVSRFVSPNRVWQTRDMQTGAIAPLVTFGTSSGARVVGDYDGDTKGDHAIFDSTPSASPVGFRIRRSTDPTGPIWTVAVGAVNDIPVATSRIQ